MKANSKRNAMTGAVLLFSFPCLLFAQQQMLPEFTVIKANGAFQLYLTQGDSNYVRIEADSGSSNRIRAEVKSGTLQLSPEGKMRNTKVKVYVSTKKLNKVDINGSIDLKGLSPITTDTLEVITSGAGDITLNIKADKVSASARGAGDIRLSGSSREMELDASGAGDIKAFDLEAEIAKLRASGAGDIRVNVKSKLDAKASGAGDILYKGTPQDRNVTISGAGSIRQASADAKENEGDTTRIRVGNKKLLIVSEDDPDDDDEKDDVDIQWDGEDPRHGEHREHHRKEKEKGDFKHWNGIFIASTGYLNKSNELSLPNNFEFLELDYSRSLSWGINFFEKDIHIYKNHVNLVTGFGIAFNGYSFKNNITLRTDTGYIAATKNAQADFSKNKLRTTLLHLPLMLEFNSNPDKDGETYHLAAGAILGYKIGSTTKQVYELNGKKYKEKVKDDYNLAPFQYSATLRAGYGDVTVFANYALSEFFEKNKGPQLHPFSLGISLGL